MIALFFSRRLTEEIESDWPSVCQRLKRIHKCLLDREHMLINLTVDQEAMPGIMTQIDTFIADLPADGSSATQHGPAALSESEALTAPTRVNYVGCAANLF